MSIPSPTAAYTSPFVKPSTSALPLPGSAQSTPVPPQGGTPFQSSPPILRLNLFDTLEINSTKPKPTATFSDKMLYQYLHPFKTQKLKEKLSARLDGTGETPEARVIMFQKLYNGVNLEGQQELERLLASGRLLDNSAEDKHSTLYHLYAILTTPRASHLKNDTLTEEMLRILYKPYTITQKFEPLAGNIADEMFKDRNSKTPIPGSDINPKWDSVPLDDLDVQNHGNNCVTASLMFYMADKQPAELTRQVNEMTSPMLAFYKRIPTASIAPGSAGNAYQVLRDYHIPFAVSGPDAVTIKVALPLTAYMRTVNDSFININGRRTGVETAIQLAYTWLATKGNYDPATDYCYYPNKPGFRDNGLNGDENAMLQSLIKGKGRFEPVFYQLAGSSPNDPNDKTPYLYGYNRTFEQMTGDILASLKMGEPVILGYVNTDSDGSIVSPHEITVTGAYLDPKTKEINFVVADSDDNIEEPVIWPARNIPQVHHAIFPAPIADKINQEIAAVPGYYIPSKEDSVHFDPVALAKEQQPPAGRDQQQPVPNAA